MLRKTMIPLALLIVVVVGFSQEMPYDIVWSRCNGWGEISGSFIDVLDSGNMILTGYSERTHLYKLNSEGDTLSSSIYGSAQRNFRITNSLLSEDNGLYYSWFFLEDDWNTPDFPNGHYCSGYHRYDTTLNILGGSEFSDARGHVFVNCVGRNLGCTYLCGFFRADDRHASYNDVREYILTDPRVTIDCGGSTTDEAVDIAFDDSGFHYVLVKTKSSTGDVPPGTVGSYDIWLYKRYRRNEIDTGWVYGGADADLPEHIIPCSEGGFLIGGTTHSNDRIFDMNKGLSDVFLLRINEAGEMLWANTYGGSSFDHGKNVIETENGYVIVGSTYSNDYDVSGYHGNSDGWVFGVDFDGNLLWQRCFGGSGADILKDIDLCPDGSIVVSGQTCSSDGDIYDPVYGSALWAMKLATPEAVHENDVLPDNLSLSAYPNPFNSSLRIDAPTNATSVSICDIRGIKVAEFECKSDKSITWQAGPDISSGIYWVSAFQAGELINTMKVTLIR